MVEALNLPRELYLKQEGLAIIKYIGANLQEWVLLYNLQHGHNGEFS